VGLVDGWMDGWMVGWIDGAPKDQGTFRAFHFLRVCECVFFLLLFCSLLAAVGAISWQQEAQQ